MRPDTLIELAKPPRIDGSRDVPHAGRVTYVRGAAGAADPRRALRAAAAVVALCLVALTVALAVDAVLGYRRAGRVAHDGVPVDATVAQCLGIASGTGITVAGYRCTGSFTLAGRSYTATVHGTSQRYESGQVLAARVDPRDPSNLSVARGDPSLVPFVAPAIGAVLVLGWACVWAYRRARAGRAGRRAASSASS